MSNNSADDDPYETTGTRTVTGTPFWMAPEVVIGQGCGKRSDVWSLGCTLVEMLTGKPPWSLNDGITGDGNQFTIMFRIGNSDEVPKWPGGVSKECEEFLKRCLVRDPRGRASAEQLARLPFVTDV